MRYDYTIMKNKDFHGLLNYLQCVRSNIEIHCSVYTQNPRAKY